MIQLVYLLIGFVVGVFGLMVSWAWVPDKSMFLGLVVVEFVVFAIWIIVIISDIRYEIKSQLDDFHSLDSIKKEKESYEAEMDHYNKEMKAELLTEYREFEESIMSSIKDSKIIATILEKSGYSSVLTSYNNRIKEYLTLIHNSDRKIQNTIKEMKIRQEDSIYSYGMIIPENLKYRG